VPSSAAPIAPPAVLLTVEARGPHAHAAARTLLAAGAEFLAELGLENRQLSLLLATDARIRALNRAHRGVDRPTDVLSFPQEEPAKASALLQARSGLSARRRALRPAPLGDVAISLPAAIRQASAGGWPLGAELRRLLAHGLLHCLGHDHGRPADAARMATAERALLGADGLVGDVLPVARPASSREGPAPGRARRRSGRR
jgi:probable rRNA maturation factor